MMVKTLITSVLFFTVFTGCQINKLEEPIDCAQSDLTFEVVVQHTECGETTGRIEIIATGGLEPYVYSIDNEPGRTSAIFDNLGAGEYNILLTDKSGCTSENAALITNINGLVVSASSTASDCFQNSGILTIIAENGVEPYRYQVDNSPSQPSPEIILGAGQYTITVTDATGCVFVFISQIKSNASYQTDIWPIIVQNCSTTGCHDGSNSLPNWNNFSEVQSKASIIRSRTQSRNMPRNGSLTQAQIDLIACWVDDGALNN